jgi:Ca-activated chloride channel homolog
MRMTMKTRHAALAFLLFCLAVAPSAMSQSYRSSVRDGNELYKQKQYEEAAKRYRDAATAKPERMESHFNLGNTAYRTDDVKAAIDAYKKAAERGRDKEEIATSLYNIGNAFLSAADKAQQLQQPQQPGAEEAQKLREDGYRQAIEAYKNSLKLNPDDEDTRYNLMYAMRRLEQMKSQQNQQKKEQKQDKQQQQKQQQQQQNKDDKKKEQQQKQQQQQQQQQKDGKSEQQKPPPPQDDKKMSKQQADQILKALERQEKDLQKKLREKRAVRVQVDKDW